MTDETQRIERDLETTRARLDARISELQDKLSPGQLLDQGLSYLRDNGGADLGRNLKESVVQNPIPLALVGIGLAWLMMGSRRPPHADEDGSWRGDEDRGSRGFSHDGRAGIGSGMHAYAGESRTGYASEGHTGPGRGAAGGQRVFGTGSGEGAAGRMPWEQGRGGQEDLHARAEAAAAAIRRRQDETLEDYEDRAYAARGEVFGITRHAGEARAAFMERVDRAMHGARDMLGDLKERAHEIGERASEWLESGRERADETRRHLMERAREATEYGRRQVYYGRRSARDLTSRAMDYAYEQPWVLAAAGLALGALIGGLLPASRYERRALGPIGRDLKERASGLVDQAVRAGSEVASEVVDAAAEAARREGLTLDAGKDAVSGLAGKVRHVVEESVEAGKEALQREAGAVLAAAGEPKDTERGKAAPARPTGPTSTGPLSTGPLSTGPTSAGSSAGIGGTSGGQGQGVGPDKGSSELPSSRDVGLARGEAQDLANKAI